MNFKVFSPKTYIYAIEILLISISEFLATIIGKTELYINYCIPGLLPYREFKFVVWCKTFDSFFRRK